MAEKKNAFPKPKWPPIQQLESVDIIAKRKDGGVGLIIIASQSLDDARKLWTASATRSRIIST